MYHYRSEGTPASELAMLTLVQFDITTQVSLFARVFVLRIATRLKRPFNIIVAREARRRVLYKRDFQALTIVLTVLIFIMSPITD